MVRHSLGLLLVLACLCPSAVFAREKETPRYPLGMPPLEILDGLKDLPFGVAPKLPADERAFLEKIWKLQDGNKTGPVVDDALLLDAMLFASGVSGEADMKTWRAKFDALMEQAKASVKGAKSDRERGDKLLTFLHKDLMAKGYELNQSSFTEVFETGKYNCVSSTAVYYLVGKRLGLTIKPLSIPGGLFLAGHATADLIDGTKRIEVECTNPDGFDWEAKMSRLGVFTIGFVPNRKNGHEADGLGVAAMIYSNRGVGMKDDTAGQLESARFYVPALILDPADKTAQNNLMVGFVNGGPKLIKEGKHEEATRLVAYGMRIRPDQSGLTNNRWIVWCEYIEKLIMAGKDKEAVELIRRGKKEMPEAWELNSAAEWYRRAGRKIIKDKGWEEGLKLVDRSEKVMRKEEFAEMLEWRGDTYRHWSDSMLDKGSVEESMTVLARGYAINPKDRAIISALAYHTRESLWIVRKKSGIPAMLEHFKKLRQKFPGEKVIGEMAWGHAINSVGELRKAGKHRKALDHIVELKLLFGTDEQGAKAVAGVYDSWARDFVEKKEWTKALDRYKEGLAACPGQD